MKYTDIIDKYLDGEMTPQEKAAFEQEAKTDPELAHELKLHQLAVAGVQHSEEARFQEFKSVLIPLLLLYFLLPFSGGQSNPIAATSNQLIEFYRAKAQVLKADALYRQGNKIEALQTLKSINKPDDNTLYEKVQKIITEME